MPDAPESQTPDADGDATEPRPSPFHGKDGVTSDERDRPRPQSHGTTASESRIRRAQPDQLPLFTHLPDDDRDDTIPTDLPPLVASSSLTLARSWYRHALERARRPRNTIESYSYDLTVLENLIGPKKLRAISGSDIARYLGEASSKTTRKRRLTSARRFFRYLIDDAKVLQNDPTDGFYPHQIRARAPRPLFGNEQDALLSAASTDEPWSAVAIWLMMRAGLTRSELLALSRDDIDRTDPAAPVIHVYYDDVARHGKERALLADEEFSAVYDAYLAARDPIDTLFPVGPPAINGMVDRVRRAAGITREVTPQTLRQTFAVEEARKGADRPQLLRMLGLADDPRNRSTVNGYIAAAAPPANAPAESLPLGGDGVESQETIDPAPDSGDDA